MTKQEGRRLLIVVVLGILAVLSFGTFVVETMLYGFN